jgi:glycosyltransferase involved in cell wall biosynthesis
MARQVFFMPLLTLKSNGGGAVAIELARVIASHGNSITILTSNYHGVDLMNLSENNKIKFKVMPAVCGKYISLIILLVYGALYSIIFRPQIIYTHSVTLLIPSFQNIKPIWLVQDIEYRFYSKKIKNIFKLLYKIAIKKKRLLITSHWLGRYFRRLGAEILYEKNIGISRKLFQNINKKIILNRENDILLISKRGDHKRGNESKVLSIILSNNGYKVVLIDQTDDKTLTPNQNFKIEKEINQELVVKYLSSTKIFINLSKSEGFGLMPVEALSAGCLVITTATPSIYGIENKNLAIINNCENVVEEAINVVKIMQNIILNEVCTTTKDIQYWLDDWASAAYNSIINDIYR